MHKYTIFIAKSRRAYTYYRLDDGGIERFIARDYDW